MATIQITKCDNQIVVYATTWNNSYQICDIQSGNNNLVDVSINLVNGAYTGPLQLNGVAPGKKLSGTYNVAIPETKVNLGIAGLDWGGEADFSVSVNGAAPYTYYKANGGAIVVPLGDPYDGSGALSNIEVALEAEAAKAN